jgi:hypothetical protein
MRNDPDYRDNQRNSQQSWIEQNRDYWRRYRNLHPNYVKRNRLLQKDRDRKRRLRHLAKMDASKQISLFNPGSYYLISAKGNLAKMDALMHEVVLIPTDYIDLAKKDPMDFLHSFS